MEMANGKAKTERQKGKDRKAAFFMTEHAKTLEAPDGMESLFTIGLIVTNQTGVLSRVTGLYSKHGCNIDSLAVAETENPSLSRMTIVSRGDAHLRTQMLRQLRKLYDVHAAALLEGRDAAETASALETLNATVAAVQERRHVPGNGNTPNNVLYINKQEGTRHGEDVL